MLGAWLTHADTALETDADFLAVCEHRLVPARVRWEWPAMRRRGVRSVGAPVSQEGSHAGHAGVGVVSLREAPLALPTFATTAFRKFFDSGRLIQCALPLGNARRVHLVVVYGFQKLTRTLRSFASPMSFLMLLCVSWQLLVVGSLV